MEKAGIKVDKCKEMRLKILIHFANALNFRNIM